MHESNLEKIAKTSSNALFDIPEADRSRFSVQLVGRYNDGSDAGQRFLDIGCNYGGFLVSLDPRNAIGIDLRRKPLLTFQKWSDEYPLFQASGTALPFLDSTFDVVFLWDVIEHVPTNTEANLLKEINRVLTRGGVLMLSTPSDNLLSIMTDPAFFLRRHRHYSVDYLRRLIQRMGFDISYSAVKGSFSSVLGVNLLYFRKWILHSGRSRLSRIQKFLDMKENVSLLSEKGGRLQIYVVATKAGT
jgi:SAM-dependent methyltransferase